MTIEQDTNNSPNLVMEGFDGGFRFRRPEASGADDLSVTVSVGPGRMSPEARFRAGSPQRYDSEAGTTAILGDDIELVAFTDSFDNPDSLDEGADFAERLADLVFELSAGEQSQTKNNRLGLIREPVEGTSYIKFRRPEAPGTEDPSVSVTTVYDEGNGTQNFRVGAVMDDSEAAQDKSYPDRLVGGHVRLAMSVRERLSGAQCDSYAERLAELVFELPPPDQNETF